MRRLVHVVDDSASMRAMAAAILEGAGFDIRDHTDASSILCGATCLGGDCIVTDVRMPYIDGLELLTRLRAAGSTMPVVVMTGHGDIATAVRAMKLGACDFIEKPFMPETLLRAVRAASCRARTTALDVERAVAAERIARLTRREREVFNLVLLGRSHREIGDELDISPRTVEVFRSRLMTKMGCRTVQDLVRAALGAGES